MADGIHTALATSFRGTDMPIDTSIYQGLLAQPRTITDYNALNAQIQGQQIQNALGSNTVNQLPIANALQGLQLQQAKIQAERATQAWAAMAPIYARMAGGQATSQPNSIVGGAPLTPAGASSLPGGPTTQNANLIGTPVPQGVGGGSQGAPMQDGGGYPISQQDAYALKGAQTGDFTGYYSAQPDIAKQLMAAGVDPSSPQGAQMILQTIKKAGYIPPTALRGIAWMDPATREVHGLPSAAPSGFQTIANPDGTFGLAPMTNGPQAVAASAAAESGGKAAGKAPYQLQTYFDPVNGVMRTNFVGNMGSAIPIPGVQTLPGSPTPQGSTIPPMSPALAKFSPAQQAAILNDMQQTGLNSANVQQGSNPVGSILPNGAAGANVPAAQAAQPDAAGIQTGPALGQVANADAQAKNAQNTMNASYQRVMAANQPAQTIQARLATIASFAPHAITSGDGEWRDFANTLLSLTPNFVPGSQGAVDRKTAGDLLDKNAAQIALAIGAGANGTDALRTLAAAANPNRHMTVAAIQEAVDELQASAKMQQAKASVLTPLYNAGKAAAYNTAEQQFDNNADYRIWQIKAATQGMNAQQMQTWLAAHHISPQQFTEINAKRKALMNTFGWPQ